MEPSDLIFLKNSEGDETTSLPLTIEGNVYVWERLSGTSHCLQYVNGELEHEVDYDGIRDILEKFT